jgi:hypothetical protein
MYKKDILDNQTIQNLLLDHEITKENGILYQGDSSDMGTSAFLSPFASLEFTEDSRLAMVYGTEPGYAWINLKALQTLQLHITQKGINIKNCGDFITALEKLGYVVKQIGNSQSSKPRGDQKKQNEKIINLLTIIALLSSIIGGIIGWSIGTTLTAMILGAVIGLVIGFLASSIFVFVIVNRR